MRINKIIPFAMASFLVGCGSGSSSKGSIDISEYLPQQDMTKTYLQTLNDGESSSRNTYEELIQVNNNQLTYKIDNQLIKTISIEENEIQEEDIIDGETNTITMKRLMDVGDTLFTQERSRQNENIVIDDVVLGTKTTESKKVCKLEAQLDALDTYSIPYEEDILKFKCIEEKTIVTDVRDDLPDYITLQDGEVKSGNDISYFYLKKGLGVIAEINDDCMVEENGVIKVDDDAQECQSNTYVHNFFLD